MPSKTTALPNQIKFGLFRHTEDKFSAKPGKVDLGKATASEAKEVQAA